MLDYNGGAILERCLRSLAQQTVFPEMLLVVNNGGNNFDETRIRILLGEGFSQILEFLHVEKNMGYVDGMNRGLNHVLNTYSSTPWVMTLSNDTEFEFNFFEKLTPLLRESRLGMIAPKVRAMNERDYLDGAGISVSLDGMSTARGQRERDLNQYDNETDILVPNGVAAIYRTALLQEVGVLDENFDAYCEDTDLGLRGWLAGWDCKFVPECVVYHQRSATFGEHSLNKLYLVERNHYWVAIKNFPLPLLALNPSFTMWRYFVQVYALVAKRGQGQGFSKDYSPFELIKTTLKSIRDAGVGAPRAFAHRKKSKSLRKRTDFEILSTLWSKRLRFEDLILK